MISSRQKSCKKIYNDLYKHGYPHGGLGFPISWSNLDIGKLICLDLGCGHGILGRRFKKYTGIDISDYVIEQNKKKYPELTFYAMDIKDISNLDNFDLVIAIDVLEHLPKDEISEYLEVISSIDSEMFLFSICCRKSGYGGNEDLHTCVMPKSEWLTEIDEYFNILSVSETNRQQTFCVKAEL